SRSARFPDPARAHPDGGVRLRTPRAGHGRTSHGPRVRPVRRLDREADPVSTSSGLVGIGLLALISGLLGLSASTATEPVTGDLADLVSFGLIGAGCLLGSVGTLVKIVAWGVREGRRTA